MFYHHLQILRRYCSTYHVHNVYKRHRLKCVYRLWWL